ncbi:hypothetical protein BT67DRAFT_74509 [Trichocladium antarcticum]|uniref:Thioredoxin-like fold domain-containing protein n=1 Tax=Trichocladium antarcticum TaxID=1450529 RepID=A0AAN6UHJ8_9PEZI|nr:hypothetical protein BT67DRAFT_74509 [Trichocladium antarcticum]
MALPPKFKGHRLTFTDPSIAARSNEALHTLEFYLDYVCPFSAKLFHNLQTNVIPHIKATPTLAPRLQFIFRQQIQPWHPSSTLTHEAAVAVERLAGGDAAVFWAFSHALLFNQPAFFDESVAAETRNQTYRRLARFAAQQVQRGAAAEAAAAYEEAVYELLRIKEGPVGGAQGANSGNAVTGDVTALVKAARASGVHVTPTVVFNGVAVGEISSGWSFEQWKEWLEKNIV